MRSFKRPIVSYSITLSILTRTQTARMVDILSLSGTITKNVMKNTLILVYLFLVPLLSFGQIKIEGIYPSEQYHSGWVTLVLSGDNHSTSGYTSFQVFNQDGDAITKETDPDYLLPINSKITYQLELVDGLQNLPDSLCGSLVLKNPEYEIKFCLNNKFQKGTPSGGHCDDFKIVDVIHSGEYWDHQVTVLLTTTNPNGTMPTGYTFFQLFDSNGDSLMLKTGPNYITPMFVTDTIAYNFDLLEDGLIESDEIDTLCFELVLENPVCTLKNCSHVNTTDQFENHISLYPNPATEMIYFWGSDVKINKVEITDLNGWIQSCYYKNIDEVNMSSFQNGIYIVNLFTDKAVITKRIIKI